MSVVTVKPGEEGLRVDSFLAKHFEGASRTAIQRMLKTGHVTLAGRPVPASHKTKVTESFRVNFPPPEPLTAAAEDIPLDVVYEDDDIVIINKPAGMVVHPAKGHTRDTLVNALLFRYKDGFFKGDVEMPRVSAPVLEEYALPEEPVDEAEPLDDDAQGAEGIASEEEVPTETAPAFAGATLRPGIVHRLDKDTTGLIAVAKNVAAHASLSAQLKSREMGREYLAVVRGSLKIPAGSIDKPIGRHKIHRRVQSGVRS